MMIVFRVVLGLVSFGMILISALTIGTLTPHVLEPQTEINLFVMKFYFFNGIGSLSILTGLMLLFLKKRTFLFFLSFGVVIWGLYNFKHWHEIFGFMPSLFANFLGILLNFVPIILGVVIYKQMHASRMKKG